ncbi:transcriptional regulator [Aciduliprofundum sp. MAR08-339]|uniref:Lrp/AsnC family transcriptional regulator n=1 Tax=Aciduliprofundum sp. (strain MAR08-339) TaxID=673860 RepID=UPI0002A47CB6|nr:transcriptional regulator [Aciduliprofundum sp. MAR08-339]
MEDDSIMSAYYSNQIVTALIGVKVDTKSIEDFANEAREFTNVEDVFLVTGEYDIIVKVKFPSYGELKDFIVNKLSKLDGVMKTETMMVVNTYKERGIKFE